MCIERHSSRHALQKVVGQDRVVVGERDEIAAEVGEGGVARLRESTARPQADHLEL
jgi:hypothetical protein